MKALDKERPPTLDELETIQDAFSLLNSELFESKLPDVIFTLVRYKKSRGHFYVKEWSLKGDPKTSIHCINLSPTHLGASNKTIIQILAHEMTHLWQQEYGKPSGFGYHNTEWAEKMLAIGLQPVSLHHPGVMTGQNITDRVIPKGKFDLLINDSSFNIKYFVKETIKEKGTKEKKQKTKYTCPSCQCHLWGKPNLHIECGDCHSKFEEEGLADDLKKVRQLYRTI